MPNRRYFVKLTSELQAKNKPQLEIINYLKYAADRRIIDELEVLNFKQKLFTIFDEIHAKHPRCKKLEVTFKIDQTSGCFDRVFYSDIFTLRLYEEKE